MAKQSDNPIAERDISATEATRCFSKILDEIEAGRRFLVRRHGRAVCIMAPAPVRARRASECLECLRGRRGVRLDHGFGVDLLDVLAEERGAKRPMRSAR